MEKIMPVLLVKNEFAYLEKIKLKGFLWNIRTIKILTQRKENDFLAECSPTSAVFSIEILMEAIELVVAEN